MCVFVCVCNKACHNLHIRDVFVINKSYMFASVGICCDLLHTHTQAHSRKKNSTGNFKFVIR